jgi:type IV pilus assembly protein PilA
MAYPMHSETAMRSKRALGVRAAKRAFTLVELMIVVAIIGVLALIAIVGYRRYVLSSKVSEAQNVIGAIKIAQEDFKAERGTYFASATWCPWGGVGGAAAPGNRLMQWTSICWAALPVHVEAPVRFNYYTDGGLPGTWAAPGGTGFAGWLAVTDRPWYVIEAQADLRSDGTPYTGLSTASNTTTLFVQNEGE